MCEKILSTSGVHPPSLSSILNYSSPLLSSHIPLHLIFTLLPFSSPNLSCRRDNKGCRTSSKMLLMVRGSKGIYGWEGEEKGAPMLVNRFPTSTCSTSSRVARTTAKYLSIISFRPLVLSSPPPPSSLLPPPSSLLPPPFYMLTKQTVVDVHRDWEAHRVGTFSPPPPFPSPLLSFLSLFSLILSYPLFLLPFSSLSPHFLFSLFFRSHQTLHHQ